MKFSNSIYLIILSITSIIVVQGEGLPLFLSRPLPDKIPLYYWQSGVFTNFGDYLSLKLLERIVNGPVQIHQKQKGSDEKKLLAVGSIISFAATGDVIWGSGINGKALALSNYKFSNLDVRAVRGPLTRYFLMHNFNIKVPEVYGDPALLIPYFFPEFKRKAKPTHEYLIIPHYSEQMLFPKELYKNVVYPTDPWDKVIEKILDSKFIISGSLHGIIIAEAFGIPARLLRITYTEHIFKFMDYYLGTGRSGDCKFASSISEALKMGGEPPIKCDLLKLYQAFPFEFWPNATFVVPNFTSHRGARA